MVNQNENRSNENENHNDDQSYSNMDLLANNLFVDFMLNLNGSND